MTTYRPWVSTVLIGAATALAAVSISYADDALSIDAAIAHEDRLPEDFNLDKNRRPEAVLAAFNVQPGSVVFDVFSGGGYYTELFSHIVGDEGRVIAHANTAYRRFAGDIVDRRYGDDGMRLGNVERRIAEVDALEFKPSSLDFVSMVLTFHDFFFENEDWPAIDEVRFVEKLHGAVKPGGRVGVVDHQAAEGRGTEDVFSLHRIEQDVVIRIFEDAGFRLIAESPALRNPEDDHRRSVFDPSIRRRTDRFILVFERP